LKDIALFLADSGPTVGLGHLRRLLVLAAELAGRGLECGFLLTNIADADFAERAGFAASPWLNRLDALPAAKFVAIDGYCFDLSLPSRWRAQTGSVVLMVDDHAERPTDVDILLNHNLYGADLDYSDYGARRILAGPQYALIHPDFAALFGRPRPSSRRVLASFGGTDDGRYGKAATRAVLERDPDVTVDLVLASLSGKPAGPSDLESRYPGRCRVHYGASMVARMAEANLYLGAAGVTLMEAIAAGLDIIVCGIVPNQEINIRTLARLGVAAFDTFAPAAMAESAVSSLARPDHAKLNVIDGSGAKRVTDEILGFANSRHPAHQLR
jgi:spore coat polysaccharide biosynthesis predicted glycosyltransferase SpsG